MDPNVTLAKLREIKARCLKRRGDSLAFEMAVVFEDLDEWLLKGGHLPSDWEVGEREPVRVNPDPTPGPFARNYDNRRRERLVRTGPCTCECNSGGWCGGCGHAGCGGR